MVSLEALPCPQPQTEHCLLHLTCLCLDGKGSGPWLETGPYLDTPGDPGHALFSSRPRSSFQCNGLDAMGSLAPVAPMIQDPVVPTESELGPGRPPGRGRPVCPLTYSNNLRSRVLHGRIHSVSSLVVFPSTSHLRP